MDVQRFMLKLQEKRGWDDAMTRNILCHFIENLAERRILPGVGGRLVAWIQERFGEDDSPRSTAIDEEKTH